MFFQILYYYFNNFALKNFEKVELIWYHFTAKVLIVMIVENGFRCRGNFGDEAKLTETEKSISAGITIYLERNLS